jgi:hypothetical protein
LSDDHNRINWDIDQRIQHQRELDERREFWEKQQAQHREQERVANQRSEVESYLLRRGEQWTETVGSPPPADVLTRWTQEFLDEKEAMRQAEREKKINEGSVI